MANSTEDIMANITSITLMMTPEPAICKVGGKPGKLTGIPWGGDTEAKEFGTYPRGLCYVAMLVYLFMGIAIVSDVFMSAIEAITSSKKRIVLKSTNLSGETITREATVKRWNGTVANLTLMALGSSAPEILLSVIELIGNDYESGELGPSTIFLLFKTKLYVFGLAIFLCVDHTASCYVV